MRGVYPHNSEAMVINSSLSSEIRKLAVKRLWQPSDQVALCKQLMRSACRPAFCVLRSFSHNCMCMSHQGSSWMLWVLTCQQQKKTEGKKGRSRETEGKINRRRRRRGRPAEEDRKQEGGKREQGRRRRRWREEKERGRGQSMLTYSGADTEYYVLYRSSNADYAGESSPPYRILSKQQLAETASICNITTHQCLGVKMVHLWI